MANLKSSEKDAIISKQRRLHNMSRRSTIKTFIKKIYLAVIQNKKEFALEVFKQLQSILDRNVVKGLIHKNKAARCKSNLYTRIMKLK
ncbi:30S ribosomal protein S20 [Buchnera aphidicola (Hormaphis cornu)]|nr:30S ribosomal protein S20 [Buchnera aphidicola (Hormaphis cornu)]